MTRYRLKRRGLPAAWWRCHQCGVEDRWMVVTTSDGKSVVRFLCDACGQGFIPHADVEAAVPVDYEAVEGQVRAAELARLRHCGCRTCRQRADAMEKREA